VGAPEPRKKVEARHPRPRTTQERASNGRPICGVAVVVDRPCGTLRETGGRRRHGQDAQATRSDGAALRSGRCGGAPTFRSRRRARPAPPPSTDRTARGGRGDSLERGASPGNGTRPSVLAARGLVYGASSHGLPTRGGGRASAPARGIWARRRRRRARERPADLACHLRSRQISTQRTNRVEPRTPPGFGGAAGEQESAEDTSSAGSGQSPEAAGGRARRRQPRQDPDRRRRRRRDPGSAGVSRGRLDDLTGVAQKASGPGSRPGHPLNHRTTRPMNPSQQSVAQPTTSAAPLQQPSPQPRARHARRRRRSTARRAQ
jgi:hypothetical protein